MYEQFYGLAERPFDLTPNPRYLLLTPSHREALANLDYGISSRKGLIVLTGEAGTGKTTLLRRVMAKGVSGTGRTRSVRTVYLSNPTLDRSEFVEYLARGFGLSPDAHTSKARLLAELEATLTGLAARRHGCRADHRRGAEPAVRAHGRDAAAGEHRVGHRQAAAGRAGRAAGTPASRAVRSRSHRPARPRRAATRRRRTWISPDATPRAR